MTALFDASGFDGAVRVEDSMGVSLGQSNTNMGNRESVTFTATGGQTYTVGFFKVMGDGPYFLRIE